MGIYELRKLVTVIAYFNFTGGAHVIYRITDKVNTIDLSNIQLFDELLAIGSIEEDCNPEEFNEYRISQWDALNIAIRYELEREMEKESGMMDIQNAIDKLKHK